MSSSSCRACRAMATVHFRPDQLGQHVRPAHDRNGPRPRRIHFRVAALDGGRDHQRAGAFDVLGLVADHDLRAALGEPVGVGAGLHVRTGDLIAEVQHHFSDARHADAANTHEMNRADVKGRRLAHRGPVRKACATGTVPGDEVYSPATRSVDEAELLRRSHLRRLLGEVGEIARGVRVFRAARTPWPGRAARRRWRCVPAEAGQASPR